MAPSSRRPRNSQGDGMRSADEELAVPDVEDPTSFNPQPVRHPQPVRCPVLGMGQQIGYPNTDDQSCIGFGSMLAKESPDCKRHSDAGNSRPLSTISTAATGSPLPHAYAESPHMTSPGLCDRRLASVSNSPEIKEGPEDTNYPPQWPLRNSFQQRPTDSGGGVARTPSREHETASQRASPGPAYWNHDEPETAGKNKKVFVGGVPQDVGSMELQGVFSQFGNVKKAWTQKCHSTSSAAGDGRSSQQQHRGFGFVIFESSDSVERLLGDKKSHHIRLSTGKRIEVKHALSSNKLENRQQQNGRSKPKTRGDNRAQDNFGGRESAAASPSVDRERSPLSGYPAQPLPSAGAVLSTPCEATGVGMNAYCGDSAAGPPMAHMMSAGQQYHMPQPQQGYLIVPQHGDGSQLSQCNAAQANMPVPQPCAALQDGRATWLPHQVAQQSMQQHPSGASHQSTAQPPQHTMLVPAMQAQPQRQVSQPQQQQIFQPNGMQGVPPQQQQQRMQQNAPQPSYQQCAGRYHQNPYQTASMFPVPYPQAMCPAQGMLHMHQQVNVNVAYPQQQPQQQQQQSLQSAMAQPQQFHQLGIPIQHHNQQHHMQPHLQDMMECPRSVSTHQPDAAAGGMHLGQQSQVVGVNHAGMIEVPGVLSAGQAPGGPRQ